MRWLKDDSQKFYLACAALFALGLLSTRLGLIGFAFAVLGAFLLARFATLWIRNRFRIASDIPDDRLDLALKQSSFQDAIQALLKGNPRP